MGQLSGRSLAVLSLLVFGLSPVVAQKAAPAATSDTPVFRSETRIVLVDVVATDASGNPVHGLKAEDFQVFESGKRQRIRSFDEHTATPASDFAAEKPPHLAPGVYSNWTPTPPSGAVNIILFDTLNTDFADQSYGRRKMIEYLKTLPAGQQAALYTLGDHLRIVQSFTGSTDTLIAAANKLGALSSFRDPGKDSLPEDSNQLQLPAGATGAETHSQAESMQANLPAGAQSTLHFASSALSAFLSQDITAVGDIRRRRTLEALRDLVRSLAAVPGRKNLIWVSGAFPALIGSYTEQSGFHLYDRELRMTAALLAANQIAVYPIDARGLIAQPVATAATTGKELIDTGNGRSAYAGALADFSHSLQATHDAMEEMAQQTGGHAFYGSNDIKNAIATSIDSGANYYTLAYTPANKNWDGQLRTIQVKIGRQNVKLNYRRGYYAVADPFAPVLNIKTTNVDVQRRLIEAVQPNSPQTSGILLRAKTNVVSADKPVEIDYVIDARGLSLSFSENGDRAVRYQLVAVAWDEHGKNVAQAWEMVDKEIKPQEAAEILSTGISSHRFLTLTPGRYSLSLGIIDVESKKIGTLVIPLKITKEAAAIQGSGNAQQ